MLFSEGSRTVTKTSAESDDKHSKESAANEVKLNEEEEPQYWRRLLTRRDDGMVSMKVKIV